MLVTILDRPRHRDLLARLQEGHPPDFLEVDADRVDKRDRVSHLDGANGLVVELDGFRAVLFVVRDLDAELLESRKDTWDPVGLEVREGRPDIVRRQVALFLSADD